MGVDPRRGMMSTEPKQGEATDMDAPSRLVLLTDRRARTSLGNGKAWQ
jgi:hypothetical protein